VQKTGDVACPSELPIKKLVGTQVNASCGACSCSVSSYACAGMTRFYSDTNCGSQLATATQTCTASGASGGETVRSYRWEGRTTGTCNTGTSAASAALGGISTVCCK
jgi:hypothetical protein